MQNVQMKSTLNALVADVRWLHVVFQTNFLDMCIP